MTHTYSQSFLDAHRDINVDHDWYDSVFDDFRQICKILGIEIDAEEPRFSGFWSQGDGASWTGAYRALRYDLLKGCYIPRYDIAPVEIRQHAPLDTELHRIADELSFLARIYTPTFAAVRRYRDRYVHEMTMTLHDSEPYSEGEYCDWGDLGLATDVVDMIEETLIGLFRDLARWLYRQLENEYDYLTSDEAVADTLEANEIYEDA